MHAGGVADNSGPWNDERDPFEELVSIPTKSRDWKGIFISLVVIASVMGMIQATIELATPPPGPPRLKTSRMELRQLEEKLFVPNSLNASWVTGTKIAFINMEGGLSVFDTESETREELLDNSSFKTLNTTKYSLSPSLSFLLLSYDQKGHQSKYKLINLKKSVSQAESLLGGDFINKVVWVTDISLILQLEKSIYYMPDVNSNNSEELLKSTEETLTLTLDKQYEERMMNGHSGPWLSSDQSLVALLHHSSDHSVQCTVIRLTDKRKWKIIPPEVKSSEAFFYISSVTWADSNTLSLTWLDRSQTTIFYTLCVPPSEASNSYKCNIVGADGSYYNREESNGWVENYGPALFNSGADRMAAIIPTNQGEAGYFPHLVVFRVSTSQTGPSLPTELTAGHFEVTELNWWDWSNKKIYFTATPLSSPGDRHLYRVSDSDVAGQKESPECLTCPALSSPDNSSQYRCSFSQAVISPAGQAFIQNCLGPGIPYSIVRLLPDTSILLLLDSNRKIHEEVSRTALPQHRYLQLPLPANKLVGAPQARLHILLPPGYRQEDRIAFPTLLSLDISPGSQQVSSQWRVDWLTYMASKKGFVIVYMDVSGSGFSGDKTRKSVHRRLTALESQDVLHIIREVEKFNFVDSRKMVLMGVGYGASITTRVLAMDSLNGSSSLVQCGVSVAPISKWEYHNSLYTERYMGFPSINDNWEGYNEADLTKQVSGLRDESLLIVHGMSDDKVEVSQSWYLTQALVKHDILFTQMFYPGAGHNLGSSAVASHFHGNIESFFSSCVGSQALLSPLGSPYTQSDVREQDKADGWI